MTTWGFIGSGNISATVARLAVAAGDHLEAKEIVSEHLDEIGYDSVDLGPLTEGWRTQPDTAAYGLMYAVDLQAWDQGARPASLVEVAERAAVSRRQRPGKSRP